MKIPAEISGFRLVVLFHSSMAARSAAPWFGSKSHSTAPLDHFFDFSFTSSMSPGLHLCIPWREYICYQYISSIIYSYLLFTTSDSLFLHPALYQNLHLTLCGRIWCGVGLWLFFIKSPAVFIDLIIVYSDICVVAMAYPTALHKFLQGLRVWLLW